MPYGKMMDSDWASNGVNTYSTKVHWWDVLFGLNRLNTLNGKRFFEGASALREGFTQEKDFCYEDESF